MLSSTLVLILLALSSLAGAMVIQSRWSHIRLKTLPPVLVEGREGGNVVLLCSATGSPAPRLAWYKDSLFVSHLDWSVEEDVSSIGETVAKLTIPCLTNKHEGVYECRARAGEHEVSTTTILKVVPNDGEAAGVCVDNGRPSISLWKETLLVEEGDTAVLPCRVENDVSGHQVLWRNSDGAAAQGNDVRISVQPNGDLVIRELRFSDMGQYMCTVTGSGGSDTIHTFLYPLAASSDSSTDLEK